MGYYEEVLELAVRILSVTPGSPAELAGITADGSILSINGEPILDEIDYQQVDTKMQALTASSKDYLARALCFDSEKA